MKFNVLSIILKKIDKFFYDIKKEYPEEFKMIRFDTNGHSPSSKIVSEAKMDMLICGDLFSLGINFNPHIVSKQILEDFTEIEKKEIYINIAKKMYNEFGCDMNGNHNKRTKFSSLEDLH